MGRAPRLQIPLKATVQPTSAVIKLELLLRTRWPPKLDTHSYECVMYTDVIIVDNELLIHFNDAFVKHAYPLVRKTPSNMNIWYMNTILRSWFGTATLLPVPAPDILRLNIV